jgi:hypothetical protein
MAETKNDFQTTALEYAITLANEFNDAEKYSLEESVAIRANLANKLYSAIMGHAVTSAEIKAIVNESKSQQ